MLLCDNSGTILIWNWILYCRQHFRWFRISFFSWYPYFWSNTNSCSRQKRNGSWYFGLKNISLGYYVSNWLIKVYVLVPFCVLVDSLVVLYISALGYTKSTFIFSILSLGATGSISASLSSKSSLDSCFITVDIEWNSSSSVM